MSSAYSGTGEPMQRRVHIQPQGRRIYRRSFRKVPRTKYRSFNHPWGVQGVVKVNLWAQNDRDHIRW
jgi:hypothetical protein